MRAERHRGNIDAGRRPGMRGASRKLPITEKGPQTSLQPKLRDATSPARIYAVPTFQERHSSTRIGAGHFSRYAWVLTQMQFADVIDLIAHLAEDAI